MTPTYVVISPVRNEEQYLEETIRSMVSQTARPLEWIIVNDGSCDRTREIIDSWAARLPWIVPVHLADYGDSPLGRQAAKEGRRLRATQAKEIEAFYRGYGQVSQRWRYVVKLDGDVSFEPAYFERCLQQFEQDAELGIGGGTIYHLEAGNWVAERQPEFHVRGATKIYRLECWNAIGGVRRGAGWDTVDEVKANMLGWKTRTFEHLAVFHHRRTGAANGTWGNGVKNGIWSYVIGYHPLFILARCGKAVASDGGLLNSAGILWGFVSSYWLGVSQIEDPALVAYLREQQIRRLSLRGGVWR